MRRAVVVIALLAASCAPADSPVVVGAVYPTHGGQGPGGIEEYRGAELAATLIDANGGVGGKRVKLELVPTDSADGVPDAIRSLHQRGASVILGSYGSTLSAVAARIAERENIVFWETGAVGEVPGSVASSNRFFRVPPTGSSLGRAASTFVHDVLLPKLGIQRTPRYAVAYVNDAYGRAVGSGAIAGIEDNGATPRRFPYDLDSVNYDDLAKRIGRAGTQVLVVGAYVDDGVGLRRALVRNGVHLIAGIGTSSSYCMPEFGRRLGADAVGLFASDKPDGPSLDAKRLKPVAAKALGWARLEYNRRYHTDMSAATLAGFAGAWALFHDVMPRAENTSPEAIAASAVRTKLAVGGLPNGSGLDLSHPGSNARAVSVIWEWTRPAYRTIVWPKPFAWEPIVPISPR